MLYIQNKFTVAKKERETLVQWKKSKKSRARQKVLKIFMQGTKTIYPQQIYSARQKIPCPYDIFRSP